jgi:hypothetical protein
LYDLVPGGDFRELIKEIGQFAELIERGERVLEEQKS